MALSTAFSTVEKLARTGRWQRFAYQPLRYAQAMWFKEVTYPATKRGQLRQATTFFGQPMQLILPAGMDIYLTGGKTHDSELRLTRWLLQQLSEGQTFVDVGAHFGYFSLLAAHLLGENGQVFAFEAAASTFELLQQNTKNLQTIQIHHAAVSNRKDTLTFYEFPVLYSEYNTLDSSQFESEWWYQNNLPKAVQVATLKLDDFFKSESRTPDFIKIDAEGAELQILQGATELLQKSAPTVIFEYQQQAAQPSIYEQAVQLLNKQGYKILIITETGYEEKCADVPAYLAQKKIQSDNIIARKL